MKTTIRTFLLIFFSMASSTAFAQEFVRVRGKVTEPRSGQPVPYASVVAFDKNSEEMISGTTTDDLGLFRFRVETSDFIVKVSFIGFETKIIQDFKVVDGVVRLGNVVLNENAESLDEVEVIAERSSMEFKLDKRVFNVGKDLTSTGRGALDLLNNVPSVNVDIEGQITLRGKAGVQILINGKPSVLSDEGSTALGTLTADMIEKIEVITNPSAKYEAEGSSGIINLVLKKEEKKGFNGSVSLNTGSPANHNLGVSLNKRTENFNFFTQFGAGYRSLPRFRESANLDKLAGSTVRTDGTEYRNERFFNITLGTDYHINDLNVVTLSGSFAFEDEDQPSETDFWITAADEELISSYKREETTEAENPKYQYDLQYEKKFKDNKEHVLQVSAQGNFFGKEQASHFENTLSSGELLDPNQRTTTNFYQRDYIFKLDYTDPISKTVTIEAGGQYDINDVGNDYAVFEQDSTGEYVVLPRLTNNFEFDQKVLGVYLTGAYEKGRWGLKLGARVENTDLKTRLITTEQSNEQNYTNLFPSVHTSYKVTDRLSLQAGYSRRIFRPRLWHLNPFFNIRNNYNIRSGNPLLQPEFTDSYEITTIMTFEKFSINASIYHLYTIDVIERVNVFQDNTTLNLPVNLGFNNQTGFEVNGKYKANKWFSLNGDFNYGVFDRNGNYEEQDFDFSGDQWSARITTRFKIPADVELEIMGNYRSPYKTVQGRISGTGFLDVGLRKKLWKGKAVVNFSIRDVFASRFRENKVDQPTFNLYDFSQRGRFIVLGFSYSFGKGEVMTYSGRGRRR